MRNETQFLKKYERRVSIQNNESGCKFGAECSFPRWKVEEQPNKKPKKGDDKVQLLL